MAEPENYFHASLSSKQKLTTYAVGFGVGLGVPLILGAAFAVAFNTIVPLSLPLLFGSALFWVWLHRTIGYQLNSNAIAILRPHRSKVIKLSNIASVRFPASRPPGNVLGLWRVEGIFGTQGTYWNKIWGRFQVFLTNDQTVVEILFKDGRRILVSPDEPERFVRQVQAMLGQ